MPYDFPPNIQQLLRQHLSSGDYASEDEVLLDALRSLAERNADLAAVKEAITDMEAGDQGEPLEQIAEQIRAKHGWSAD